MKPLPELGRAQRRPAGRTPSRPDAHARGAPPHSGEREVRIGGDLPGAGKRLHSGGRKTLSPGVEWAFRAHPLTGRVTDAAERVRFGASVIASGGSLRAWRLTLCGATRFVCARLASEKRRKSPLIKRNLEATFSDVWSNPCFCWPKSRTRPRSRGSQRRGWAKARASWW